MEKPIQNYWQLRLGNLKEALAANKVVLINENLGL